MAVASVPLLLSFGNPLLDLVAVMESEAEESAFVERHEIRARVGQECDTEANGLRDAVKNRKLNSSPGGCALNTSRVASWVNSARPAGEKPDVVFVGSVGEDDLSEQLTDMLLADGVTPRFARKAAYPTGHCVALAFGEERTMCANLGAANYFDANDLVAANVDELIKGRSRVLIFVEAFFAFHSWDAVIALADKYSHMDGFTFAFNLCGEYVFDQEQFATKLWNMLQRIDILFGNADELEAFVSALEKEGIAEGKRLKDAATSISNEASTVNGMHVPTGSSGGPVVVITDGPRPVRHFKWDAAHGRASLRADVKVARVDIIEDTVGAGDSFVAGYLTAFMDGEDTKERVERGVKVAQVMLGQPGTKLPLEPFHR